MTRLMLYSIVKLVGRNLVKIKQHFAHCNFVKHIRFEGVSILYWADIGSEWLSEIAEVSQRVTVDGLFI